MCNRETSFQTRGRNTVWCLFYFHFFCIKALSCLRQKSFWRLLFSGLRGCWSHALSAVWLHLALSGFSVKPRLAQGRWVFSNVHTATIKGYLDSLSLYYWFIWAFLDPETISKISYSTTKDNAALLHLVHWHLSGPFLWDACCHSDSTR